MEGKPEFWPHTVVAHTTPKARSFAHERWCLWGPSRGNTCSLKKKKNQVHLKNTHETNLFMTPLKPSFKKEGERLMLMAALCVIGDGGSDPTPRLCV